MFDVLYTTDIRAIVDWNSVTSRSACSKLRRRAHAYSLRVSVLHCKSAVNRIFVVDLRFPAFVFLSDLLSTLPDILQFQTSLRCR